MRKEREERDGGSFVAGQQGRNKIAALHPPLISSPPMEEKGNLQEGGEEEV